jgi:hypothetical protein
VLKLTGWYIAANVPPPVDPVPPPDPVAPIAPCGIPKFNTAAELVPLFVTVACDPAASVVTVPTATVAAVPAAPVGPAPPASASTAQLCGFVSGSALLFATTARYVEFANVTASFTA